MQDEKKEVQKVPQENYVMNPERLLEKAIENPNVTVDTLERLMALRQQLSAEFARNQFITSMSEFQEKCPVIEKKKGVLNKDKKGIRYSYAPLEYITEKTKKLRVQFGFSYSFDTEVSIEKNEVKVICTAQHKDGHSNTSEFQVPVDPLAYMNAPQKFASAMTYAKRYAFINVFGIITAEEDNDALTSPKNDRYTTEQMAEIEKLGKEAKLTQAEVAQGIRKHYKVSITQLTKTQADGVITMLKKTITDKEEGKTV